MGVKQEKKLHIAMYPWFAIGHITPLLHLANKLAKRGHKISILLPQKAQLKLASHNRHPHLITFITVAIPAVDGLPIGAETTNDIPFGSQFPLMAAMDLTYPTIDSLLSQLKPDVVFFDYARWLPGLGRKHGFKSVVFIVGHMSHVAYMSSRARGIPRGVAPLFSEADLKRAPPGFPSSAFRLRAHEARSLVTVSSPARIYFKERVEAAIDESDAVCCKSCRELEGPYGDYFEEHHRKKLLWPGPMLPEPAEDDESERLDEKLDGWLNGFEAGTVVYCALGSECVMEKEQFQEFALGLELTGLPFLAVLRPPNGYETIESALPEGFLERTKERGIIQNGWVQQQLILKHPSIGYFVSHCGAGSLLEALVSECQLVLLPQRGDQFSNARLMSGDLKVGVEVETSEDDGFFTKEAICKAITMVMMDSKTDVGQEIRANHSKWREFLLREELEESYMSGFVEDLHNLLQSS